ncbi:MAG: biotin carboxylase N-terminal domain-containing protein [Leptospiraceae bacterium]|nr:biotin carboxylase N-terminal domain-containing protein [Leptospiraceae bacterium]
MKKINKILVANRGEIAIRIIRTCDRLGISTVAVFSDIDTDSLHVKKAKEKYRLGKSESSDSYLNIEKIIEACKKTKADAVHPGYGFLSENYEFAKRLEEEGIVFIGPSPNAIQIMGDKIESKRRMISHNVPVIPGYDGSEQSPESLLLQAKKIGFPVMIKASAGGGGRGIRKVFKEDEFIEALNGAKREAKNFFKNDSVFLEKLILNPRHIEVQVLSDFLGNHNIIFDRDCSIQRRNQKLIEEAPAPNLPDEIRKKIYESAIQAAKSVNYTNAGTVEFVYKDNQYYFLEMNTRLQVEHPVTEMISGLDLVEAQIRIARGEEFIFDKNSKPKGHSIELRICAETGTLDSIPFSGKIVNYSEPKHFRVDSGVSTGSIVSIYYDSLLAKLIVHEDTREKAISKSIFALKNFVIQGVETNKEYLKKILTLEEFENTSMHTSILEKKDEILKSQIKDSRSHALAMAHIVSNQLYSNRFENFKLWENHKSELEDFVYTKSLNDTKEYILNNKKYRVKFLPKYFEFRIEGEEFTDEVILPKDSFLKDEKFILNELEFFSYSRLGNSIFIHLEGENFEIKTYEKDSNKLKQSSYRAKMPGKITSIKVIKNHSYNEGEVLAVIEAMKMEHQIIAHEKIRIDEIFFKEGDFINPEEDIFKFQKIV